MKILTHTILSAIVLFCTVAAGEARAQGHPGQYERADIEVGSRLYATQCVACHGPNGDMINGIDLRRGLFKTAVTDEDLTRVLRTGRPDSGMPAFALLQPQEVTGIVAFIRAGFDASASVKLGDPSRGRDLFSGKGGCGSCHRVNGRGPRLASDLSEVGAIRTPASLQRTLLDPNRNLIPANRSLVAVTRDGKTIRGRRLNEDTYTVQLIDDQERLVSLTKSDLRSMQIVPTSTMPSYDKTLSADEISDVIAYLLTLKGL
jgi:putative heme-binding domain-containing protein